MLRLMRSLALLVVGCPVFLHALTVRPPPFSQSTSVQLQPALDPLTDPFYTVPSNISSYSPGQVLRSRQVLTLVAGASVNSYQLFYRTTNQQNEATGTVATVWIPAIPSKPRKVFSYQIAEDSVSITCAPSWSWANSSSPQAPNTLQEGFIVPWALSQGYYVVSADFLGPTSALLVGLIEARGVLDGIRATAEYLGFYNSTFEVALLGYSGAAHATVWACSEAATYAPELNIVGAAYGGTPVDLLSTYNLVNAGPYASVAIAGFVGNANGFPEVNKTIYPLLTAHGKQIWEGIQAPTYCVLADPTRYHGTNFTSLFTKDIFDIPLLATLISKQSLLSNVNPLPIPVPTFPRLEWHGLNDTVAPVKSEIEYVKQQCDAGKGADIRLGLFPGLQHVPNMINGLPGALLFIQQAFDKTLKSGACGSNTTWPKIGSDAAVELLGEDNNAALASLLIAASL